MIQKSGISLIIDVPVTFWFIKLDDKLTEIGFEINENFLTENSEHKIVVRELLARKEIIPNTLVIQGRRVTEFMDHGQTK